VTGSRASSFSLTKVLAALAAATLGLLLMIPAARSNASVVAWNAPTPADGKQFTVKSGGQVAFSLTASTTLSDAIVHIAASKMVQGAAFNSSDGIAARATFTWIPEEAGDYTLQFKASTVSVGDVASVSAPTRTYHVHVKPASGPDVKYPHSYELTTDKVARWAVVLKRAAVRVRPKLSAPAFTQIPTMTSDDTQNVVLVLEGRDMSESKTWYRVRLPILPNNSTGWVQASDLGTLYTVRTHLYVNRAKLTATLKRDGRTIFTTIVGVGKSYWPTPRGEFYIRSKLTDFGDPFYGPVAFGTSARSAVLTDWPGGGFVGVHGTNQPEILPGRVSHGCIRMPNASILKLARLMPVGTPLTVT